MNEVVEYRNCDCGMEGCPGEKETVLFQHKDKEPCRNFMLRFPESIDAYTELLIFNDTKDKIEIKIPFSNGRVVTRRLRVQEVKVI